jgi:hypothetical protein
VIRTVIEATEVFDYEAAWKTLGLNKSTIAREVREKRLRVSKRGGKYFFTGAWLLQWVTDGEQQPRKRRTRPRTNLSATATSGNGDNE